MLKFIVFAILLTGFCACYEYHKNPDAEYASLKRKKSSSIGLTRVINAKALQTAKIVLKEENKLNFELEPFDRVKEVRFHTSEGLLTLFAIIYDISESNNARLWLSFFSPKTFKMIMVTAKVFEKPPPNRPDLVTDSEDNAAHIRIMDKDELENAVDQKDGVDKIAIFSIDWIKDYFKKAEPLFESENPLVNYRKYIGLPMLIDKDELDKLNSLTLRLGHMLRDDTAVVV